MTINTNIEFINELDSNKTINLNKGEYNISNLILKQDENVFYEDVFDGKELIIKGIRNLKLIGVNEATILADPRYANVLTFIDCDNIEINSLTLGHIKRDGSCIGGVLKFINCNNIKIFNSNLFGCGTIGLDFINCVNIEVCSTNIYECTYGIINIKDSSSIIFKNSNFFDNKGFDFIEIYGSDFIKFKGCNIYNNINDSSYSNNLFRIINSKILFEDLTIKNNIVGSISSIDYKKLFEDIDLNDNFFYSGDMFSKEFESMYEECIEEKLEEGYKLVYGNKQNIKLVKEISICDNKASKPMLSPDKSKIIFIFPFEWEILGDLYLCEVSNRAYNREIILSAKTINDKLGTNKKIKMAKWKNNEEIFLIIGQGYGTVTKGGDVYIYNIKNNKLSSLYLCKSRSAFT